jgi:uncharacterized membrane protein YkvA (DUF1232 family)
MHVHVFLTTYLSIQNFVDMELSRFSKIPLFLVVNTTIIYLYKVVLKQPLRIVETIILVFIGSVFSFSILSFLRSPSQFFRALIERIIRPFAILMILVVRIYGLIMSVFLRSGRLIIALFVSIAYGVWPIDLIPDILVGPGQLDDGVVTLLTMYWALFFGKVVISESVRETAKGINEATKISTKFP